mgnify:CR=1 FL=1
MGMGMGMGMGTGVFNVKFNRMMLISHFLTVGSLTTGGADHDLQGRAFHQGARAFSAHSSDWR